MIIKYMNCKKKENWHGRLKICVLNKIKVEVKLQMYLPMSITVGGMHICFTAKISFFSE